MEGKQTEKFGPSGLSARWAWKRINVFRGLIFKRRMIGQDLDSIGVYEEIDIFSARRLWHMFLAHAVTMALGVGLASETKVQQGNNCQWLHQPVQEQLRSHTWMRWFLCRRVCRILAHATLRLRRGPPSTDGRPPCIHQST